MCGKEGKHDADETGTIKLLTVSGTSSSSVVFSEETQRGSPPTGERWFYRDESFFDFYRNERSTFVFDENISL